MMMESLETRDKGMVWGDKGDTGVDAPEYAVARLVHLPRAQDGHVARERPLHEVRLAVELARLALRAALKDLA